MNKYTLLAATAILSMGAINTMANPTNDPTGSVTLKASATFTSPIHADVDLLNFGLLDPVKGGDVLVSPDGAYSGDAIITDSSGSGNPFPGRIILWGGFLSSQGDQPPSTFVKFAMDENTTISLIEDGSVTQSNPNGTVCGTVDNITMGEHEVIRFNDRDAFQMKFGGTLHITPGYNFTSTESHYGVCSGSKTITYILYLDPSI